MIRYHIFLVEDDVYHDYFYRTDLLNRFFTSYMAEPNRTDLKNQFNYITCPIPNHELEQTNQYIYISDRIITLFSNAQLIMDHQFLAQLEKLDQHCFIVDHTNDNYGWLNPKKNMLNSISFHNVIELDRKNHQQLSKYIDAQRYQWL